MVMENEIKELIKTASTKGDKEWMYLHGMLLAFVKIPYGVRKQIGLDLSLIAERMDKVN